MNLEDIQLLVAEKLAIEKSFTAKKQMKNTDQDVPPFTTVYQESVEMAEKIKVHSKYGVFPWKLFKEKAPNQDPKEWEYQKNNYPKPSITMPYWMKALGVINRIWNDQNWSIKWPEFEESSIYKDNQPQDYFENKYPTFGSYEVYMRQIFTNYKINDPNAFICYKPSYIPAREIEGGFVYDDTKLLEPKAYIYDCDQIWSYKENDHLLVLLKEKSIIESGKIKVREGKIFEFYDTNLILRITQIGKKENPEFDYAIYYQHNLDILPCQALKGNPSTIDGELIYQSYFLPAVGLLDEAVKNNSTKQINTYANAYGSAWEYVDPCPNQKCGQGCSPGYVVEYDGEKTIHQICSTCGGHGKKNKRSPLGVYEMEIPGRLDGDGDTAIPTPPFGFVSPGVEILKHLKDEVKDNITDGFEILNITVSNSVVKGGDTALGKQIDREEMFSFILKISDEIFEALIFGYKIQGLMRYGTDFNYPEIAAPKTFLMRSEYDYLSEINESIKAQMPTIVIREQLEEYIGLRFGTNRKFGSIVGLAFKVDRLAIMSQIDINAGISLGKIGKWEAILHDSIYQFIEETINEDPEFMEKDYKVQKEVLVQMAKAKETEIRPAETNTAAGLFKELNG